MAIITPNWTNDIVVIPKATLARGGVASGTIDLSTKNSAFLFFRIGRTSAFALSTGVNIKMNRMLNTFTQPAPMFTFTSGVAAAAITLVNGDSAAGQRTLTVQNTTGFTVGDVICVRNAALTRLEWHRLVNKSSTALILEHNLIYTHTAADADVITNRAETIMGGATGGCPTQVTIDYGDDVSGDPVVVEVIAQTYDSDTQI